MSVGWKEGRNPSANFDTKFYLRNEGDIREAGINPFRHFVLHGRREGRRATSRMPRGLDGSYAPKVSVIIPNYNHARFLKERFRSIMEQDYDNIQLIVLDDCSSDDSIDVIDDILASYAGEYKTIYNKTNSNNVFAQWKRGFEEATGDLIWICESDDTCDSEFLRQTTYLFQDPSIRIVFGDIQFINEDGAIIDGMAHLRESAQAGIWDEINVMPACAWFTGPLAVRNLIANVGGCVFRRTEIAETTWNTAKTYRVAGDWYLYVILAGGGQIAYAPDAKAYFRQHAKNTSVTAFNKTSFYEELGRFHSFLRRTWEVSYSTTLRFYAKRAGYIQ